MDLILYNPLSKNSKSNIHTHKLVKAYKKKGIPFRIKSILKIDDIVSYLQSKDKIKNVILLGGDGTINRFINEIAEYDIKQTIYLKSNGSGNDFLRSLKDNDTNPQTIMKATFDNGDSTYFMNGIGMGIDGIVTSNVNNLESKGKLRYLMATLKGLLSFVPERATVIADGKEYAYDKVYLITANNGRFFGGGMEITPKADIGDDQLDVIIVHTISKAMIIPIFFTIYLGLHLKFKKYVTNFKAKKVHVKFTTPQISQADGENEHDVISMDVSSTKKPIHLRYYREEKKR